MNGDDTLPAPGKKIASIEIGARPDDKTSVYNSLAKIEEDDNFAEAVNG